MKERGDLFSLSLSSAYRALVPDGPVLTAMGAAAASQYINQDVDRVTHRSYHTTTTSRRSASPPVPKRTLSVGRKCRGLLIKCRVPAAFYPNDRSTDSQTHTRTHTHTLPNHLTLTCLLHSFIQIQLLDKTHGEFLHAVWPLTASPFVSGGI